MREALATDRPPPRHSIKRQLGGGRPLVCILQTNRMLTRDFWSGGFRLKIQ